MRELAKLGDRRAVPIIRRAYRPKVNKSRTRGLERPRQQQAEHSRNAADREHAGIARAVSQKASERPGQPISDVL